MELRQGLKGTAPRPEVVTPSGGKDESHFVRQGTDAVARVHTIGFQGVVNG